MGKTEATHTTELCVTGFINYKKTQADLYQFITIFRLNTGCCCWTLTGNILLTCSHLDLELYCKQTLKPRTGEEIFNKLKQ